MNRSEFLAGLNMVFNSGLLTATGSETVVDTTVAINTCIDGVALLVATKADEAMPTSDSNGVLFETLAASQGCSLLFCLDAAGAMSVMQGPLETLDADNAFPKAPEYSEVPDTVVPFAAMVLKNSSAGSTFTVGTSNWDATGATNVITNICVLQSRPQT